LTGIFWKRINAEVLTLAICIAIFPPIWAVVSPYFGIQTGAVALICGGVYVANGNKRKDAVKISLGFLLGDLWALLCLKIMGIMAFNENFELFVTLFAFGGLAVLISALFPKRIYCAAWLSGWAIGLTVLPTTEAVRWAPLAFQIAVAMLIGVWYIGVGIDSTQKVFMGTIQKLNAIDKRTDYE
jgi:hypothetical protein